MSHIASAWAWQQTVGNPLRKLVLLHMADASSEHNKWQSWYSLKKIAERCNCSRGAVRNHLAALAEMGYLTKTAESTTIGRPARYRLNVGTVDVQIGPGGSDVPGTPDVPGGTGDVPGVVHQMYGGGTGDVPKPVIEPVKKEPVIETVKGEKRLLCVSPGWMPEKKWLAYLTSRKEKKHPMNQAALELCVDAIGKTSGAGVAIDEILDRMIETGWRTVKPEWFRDKDEPKKNDNAALAAKINASIDWSQVNEN